MMPKLLAATLLFIVGVTVARADLEEARAALQRGDYAIALRELRPLAEQGVPGAQFSLGVMYALGQGVIKDEAEAAKWFRQAADQGFAPAQNYLGFLYATGRGVDRDLVAALALFRKAADQGNARAQHNVGLAYEYGRGVAKDDLEAVTWYRKAADQEFAPAQASLGSAYAQGRGVAQDEAEAVKWYRKAADQGLATAQRNLGLAYARGRGTAKDEAEAMKWFHAAAQQGDADAKRQLDALTKAPAQTARPSFPQAVAQAPAVADQPPAQAAQSLGSRKNPGGANFVTPEGFDQACRESPTFPDRLRTDDERVAFVICQDTTLVKQIVAWLFYGLRRLEAEHPNDQTILVEVRKEIDFVRAQLAITRGVLEKIRLGKKKSLRLVPSQWQMDLNGDGKIELWEKYFFAIPRRGKHPFQFSMPSNDPAYYDREYQLDAAIRVDQSDVLWASAYHQLIEGLLANLRAFELDRALSQVTLVQPGLLKVAHQLIGRGIRTSEQMRKSVLAESSDDEEWIGNPRQTSSVFPIPLDEEDFVIWASVLKELNALWQGRNLLPTTQGASGLLSEFAPLCPSGTALNIARLYLNPPAVGSTFRMGQRSELLGAQCQRVDKQHPLSSLQDLVTKAQKAGSELRFLRYLYWTN